MLAALMTLPVLAAEREQCPTSALVTHATYPTMSTFEPAASPYALGSAVDRSFLDREYEACSGALANASQFSDFRYAPFPVLEECGPAVCPYKYAVVVPDDYYSTTVAYPAIVALHGGGGARGVDARAHAIYRYLSGRAEPTARPYVLILPWILGQDWDAQRMRDLIDDAVGQGLRIRTDELILAGTSLGGRAAILIGSALPDLFPEVIAQCPGDEPYDYDAKVGDIVASGQVVHVGMTSDDPVADPAAATDFVRQLNELGNDSTMTTVAVDQPTHCTGLESWVLDRIDDQLARFRAMPPSPPSSPRPPSAPPDPTVAPVEQALIRPDGIVFNRAPAVQGPDSNNYRRLLSVCFPAADGVASRLTMTSKAESYYRGGRLSVFVSSEAGTLAALHDGVSAYPTTVDALGRDLLVALGFREDTLHLVGSTTTSNTEGAEQVIALDAEAMRASTADRAFCAVFVPDEASMAQGFAQGSIRLHLQPPSPPPDAPVLAFGPSDADVLDFNARYGVGCGDVSREYTAQACCETPDAPFDVSSFGIPVGVSVAGPTCADVEATFRANPLPCCDGAGAEATHGFDVVAMDDAFFRRVGDNLKGMESIDAIHEFWTGFFGTSDLRYGVLALPHYIPDEPPFSANLSMWRTEMAFLQVMPPSLSRNLSGSTAYDLSRDSVINGVYVRRSTGTSIDLDPTLSTWATVFRGGGVAYVSGMAQTLLTTDFDDIKHMTKILEAAQSIGVDVETVLANGGYAGIVKSSFNAFAVVDTVTGVAHQFQYAAKKVLETGELDETPPPEYTDPAYSTNRAFGVAFANTELTRRETTLKLWETFGTDGKAFFLADDMIWEVIPITTAINTVGLFYGLPPLPEQSYVALPFDEFKRVWSCVVSDAYKITFRDRVECSEPTTVPLNTDACTSGGLNECLKFVCVNQYLEDKAVWPAEAGGLAGTTITEASFAYIWNNFPDTRDAGRLSVQTLWTTWTDAQKQQGAQCFAS